MAGRPMNSTRTVAASLLSLFPTASQNSPHGRIRTLGHATLGLVDKPEAIYRCPTLVADVVTSRFSNTVAVGSRPGSGSCMSPVVLAQRIDERYVQTDWLRANRSGSSGQNTGKSQSWDTQNVSRPAPTIARDDVLKNVRSLADRSQPSAFAEIEVDVPNLVVLRRGIPTIHARKAMTPAHPDVDHSSNTAC